MAAEPEIGQIVFGNPTGDYGTEPYVDALVEALLSEIERVFWNENQSEWDRSEDPKLKGVEYRRYYWGDDEGEAAKPNLKFSHSAQEIRWYKHPGRGMSSSLKMTAQEWVDWFNGALEIIRSNEKDLF